MGIVVVFLFPRCRSDMIVRFSNKIPVGVICLFVCFCLIVCYFVVVVFGVSLLLFLCLLLGFVYVSLKLYFTRDYHNGTLLTN